MWANSMPANSPLLQQSHLGACSSHSRDLLGIAFTHSFPLLFDWDSRHKKPAAETVFLSSKTAEAGGWTSALASSQAFKMRLGGLQRWPWKNTVPNNECRHNLILLLKHFLASQMTQIQGNVQGPLTLLRQMLHKHLRHKGFSCFQTWTQPMMQMHNTPQEENCPSRLFISFIASYTLKSFS